ncbi:MAG: sugar phosphate isomerase/epimerase family protein [Desulfobacteraceae bacterium]|jgi:sugar phosphate isomerase/epimerase
MIFGYSTNAFVKFPLSASLEKIADLGFEGVEIMGDRPHLYPPDFGAREIAELQAILRRRGLRVTNINSFTLFAVGDTYLPSWIEPEAERRQIRIRHTRDSLRMAAALGCRNISVPPGGPLGELSRKAALARFHAGLEQVIPLAEELDVRVLVEPEPGLMLENTAEFREFIRDVRSPLVGINFDIGHFFCAGEDPRAAFEELFQWVGHMHIEDIAPDRRHRHLIAGQGAIAFRTVFEAMARLGYAHDISLELYPYVDMPEQAGRESRDFLLPLFREAGLL